MSAKKQGNERVQTSLELLYSISRELTAQLDLRELLSRILQLTLQSVDAPTGSILVLNEFGEPMEGAIASEGKVYDHSPEQLKVIYEHGLAGWVVDKGQAALVTNTYEDSRWLKMPDEEENNEPRSAISAPLLARGSVVGVLTVIRPQAGHFSKDDLALLTAIADQAGIAVSNANLFRAEQDRRQLASTLQEISRTINSTLDPNEVFNQILEQLERVIEFDSASIFLLEDDVVRPVAARGFQNEEAVLSITFSVEDDVLGSEVFLTAKPKVVKDVQTESGWQQYAEISESTLIHGWIGAPLLVRDNVVGMLNVDSQFIGAYGPSEAEVVSAFADQAATAVANAQLYDESQRRIKSMIALTETAHVVTASLDLAEVLQSITDRTLESLEVEAASLALVDEKNEGLEFRVASGRSAEQIVGMRLKNGEGIAGWVAENDEPVLITDVKSDPRFYTSMDEKLGFETRALACAPIHGQGGTIGVLEAINPKHGSLAPEQMELLVGIAGLAGTAIAHAQLFAETQEARQRYASLFEDSIDSILIADLDGVITDANLRAETFLGYSREELLARDIMDLHEPNYEVLPADFSQLDPGETISYDSKATHRGGHTLPVAVYIKRIAIGGDSFLQFILQDIAEREELAELRTDLTSMIFHDLRSPIGNIISSLEVMKSSVSDKDEATLAVLSIAFRSSRRASRLVESLLDLDRLESDKAVLTKEQASIGALIAEAVEEVHPTAEAKGQMLKMGIPARLPLVEIDVDMIRRVLINLLDNAVKYSPGGGEIAISTEVKEGELFVSVRDSGEGISAEDREIIFDKFTRLDKQSKRKGLGLGLAFCRLAVEAHRGRIWVDSEKGKGSIFTFTLPV